MKFRCPNSRCAEGVELGERACRKCGQSLGFGTLLVLCWKAFRHWVRGATSTHCPECRAVIGLREALCPRCGRPVTFSGAVDAAVQRPRSVLGQFTKGLSPEAKTGIRWGYVIISALVFWTLVVRVDKAWTDKWYDYCMIAVVYLTFLYLFFLWVVPRALRVRVARHIRIATKVGAIFNFFSLLMLLLLFISAYWGQASKIAILFGITFAGFFVFTNIVRNLWLELAMDWDEMPSFSHLNNQGRKAYYD